MTIKKKKQISKVAIITKFFPYLAEEDEESEKKEKSSKENGPKSKYVGKMDRLMNGNVYLVQSVRTFPTCDVIIMFYTILSPVAYVLNRGSVERVYGSMEVSSCYVGKDWWCWTGWKACIGVEIVVCLDGMLWVVESVWCRAVRVVS